jgi:hypothetical protein
MPGHFTWHLILQINVIVEKYAAKEIHQQPSHIEG